MFCRLICQFPTSGLVLGDCRTFRHKTKLKYMDPWRTGLITCSQSPISVLFLLHNHPRWEQGALHSYQNAFPSMMSYPRTPWAEISVGLSVASCWSFGHNNENNFKYWPNLKLHLQDGAMHMTSRRRGLLPGGPCMQKGLGLKTSRAWMM